MFMNLKSPGPWYYCLGLKPNYFSSRAPIWHCLKLLHKTRWEQENCRTMSTCWLQGWFKFAGSESESSIWQLFCFIQALAPVLFQDTSLTGAVEAVWAVIWLVQHWYQLLRTTKGNYCLLHHIDNVLQATQGLMETQLGITRHMASLFFLKVTSPSDSWPSLWPSLGTRVLCPRQWYRFCSKGTASHQVGKSSTASRDGGWALFC